MNPFRAEIEDDSLIVSTVDVGGTWIVKIEGQAWASEQAIALSPGRALHLIGVVADAAGWAIAQNRLAAEMRKRNV
jgi:hypothetical protein